MAKKNSKTTAKPRGKPFPRGVSGNPAGRPVGAINKATKDFKEFWGQWIDSGAYQSNLQARILKGRAPHMETYIAQMVKGKPKDTIAVECGQRPLIIDAVTPEDVQRRRVADDD